MRALVIAAVCSAAATTSTVGVAAADRPTERPIERPTKVTKRFMRELLTGQRPWAEVIDPATGVFDLGYRTGEFDGDLRWGRHACDVRAPLRRLARQFGRRINLDEAELTCRNRGGVHACTIDAVGESMPAWRFEFRATPTGPMLDAVVEVNSVYHRADEARVLARLRARARPAACTP